ncbi:hypothetical protein C5471_05515 [Photorhabdus tasmaniensis]|uniref:Phage protein n=2 Tax=Photorhabdus tasmaniensis TaxID=1004159 RepID=A0ABX0GDN9_9GAMM|nr:hypothetical protein [Photorhabdus tasmaniensis]
MWQRKRLSIPAGLKPVTCSTVAVHPWSYGAGKTQSSGHYLSPDNAVNYLADKLVSAGADNNVTVLMITAASLGEFVKNLAGVGAIFPLPELKQLERKARNAANLAISKMQIPALQNSLPAPMPLSLSTVRAATAAQQLQETISQTTGGHSSETMSQMLSQFAAQRAGILKNASETLTRLQSGSFPIWALSTDNVPAAVTNMKKGIPAGDAIFTLAMLFVGEDLAQLRAMVVNDDK